jgi:hypothetical protein
VSPVDTAVVPLPVAKPVRDLLLDLLGRNVEVSTVGPWSPEPGEKATYAVYVDDRLATRALAVADLPLSGYAGGAIGLLPPGGVQDAVAEGDLSQLVVENLYEVLNICASLMNAEGTPHVKLHQMFAPGTLPPADVAAWSRTFGRRLDLEVSIAGYGSGRLSFVLV